MHIYDLLSLMVMLHLLVFFRDRSSWLLQACIQLSRSSVHRDDTLLADRLLLNRWCHTKTILERWGTHGGHLGNDTELTESAPVDLLSLRDDPVHD